MTTHSPDLYALIIRLAASQNGRLPATLGRHAHAAFLSIMRHVDPTLATTLHDMHGRRPFTVSPLEGFGYGRKGQLTIKAGQEGWLRVTLLDASLFHTFIQYFLQGSTASTIQLEGISFLVTEILSHAASHQLAGFTTVEALHNQWETAVSPSPHIPLQFRSPTAFSLRNSQFRQMHILPDPPLVFGQLATYWDALTGSETAVPVRLFCAETVAVARHDIKTHMMQFTPRRKQIGFTGQVTFEILDKTATQMMQHLNRLADLAFYTGVGSKTTQGMGQVIRIMKDER